MNSQLDSGRRTTRVLVAIVAVSVILRVAAALYHGPTIEALPGVTDQTSYHELALRVLDGHGFSFATGWWPATRANQPTAHWSFLYVLFLAGIYAVAGPVPLVARLIQAVIVGILHPWLTWRIANRMFNPTVALVSAALSSGYLYFAYYGGALVTESLYIVAFLWAIDVATVIGLAARAGRDVGMRPWVVLGVAFALAALLRQLFLLVAPFLLAWIAWQMYVVRRQEGHAASLTTLAARMAVTLAVLLAFVLPWTIRNYKAFGQFVLLNTNAGFVFFWGNHPFHGTSFVPIIPNDPSSPVNYRTLLPQEFRRMNEAEVDRALLARGLGFVKDDPVRYVRLSISRVSEYFKFWPTSDSGFVSNVSRVLSFGLVAPFLVGGLWLVSLAVRGTTALPDRCCC